MKTDTLSVVDIIPSTAADGPGWRTSIYFAGCTHHCQGCHNPQTWNFFSGRDVSYKEIFSIIRENDLDITFSGGDPFVQSVGVGHLASVIKKFFHKNIWCYTGYTFEQIMEHIDKKPWYEDSDFGSILRNIDVLVDGRFEEGLKDINLLFRGSSNQRLIDVPKSLAAGKAVLFEYDPIPKF